MTKLLLSLHVLASIVAIGPITVAASMFPRFVRPAPREGGARTAAGAALLHRICRGYTVVAAAVPVLGVATGARMGVLGDAWLIASIVLTAVAAALLLLSILPAQERLLAVTDADASGDDATTGAALSSRAATHSSARLAMTTGVFNLLWATVVVLMIVRPGSTTGA
ncbi:DUF2269 family protein [Streptomyces sp. HSG2]|uniref:DUF2269 family protein n=1 Tax=Streptomyces sp. HSG2 TaxID=2797167 RepID=UPI001906E0FC|nr:DUF2269 family protein [Streptomyces sp. HSG2]